MRGTKSILIPLCLVMCTFGCFASKKDQQPKDPEARRALRRLKVKIQEVSENYNHSVQAASRDVATKSGDPTVRRNAILWNQVTYSACQRARLNKNHYIAFLDLWTMAYQRRQLITEGEGEQMFGIAHPIVVKANAGMIDYLDQVGRQVLPGNYYEQAKADVERFARAHPIVGLKRTWRTGVTAETGGSAFVWLGQLTSPFDLGVKDTAAAISEVSGSVDTISYVAQNLPELGRWNAELMLLDLEQNPTVVTLQQDIHRVSESIADITKTAAAMPEDVQRQVSKTLDEIDAKQVGLRETIRDAKGAISEAKATVTAIERAIQEVPTTLKEADSTLGAVERITEAVARAGPAWEPTIREARELIEIVTPKPDPDAPPPPPPDPDAPNDLENLARTAEGLAKVAPDLRATVADVKSMLGSDELPQSVENTVDRTTIKLEGLIDHLTWRLIQLALAVAVVALGYRFIVARFFRSAA